MVVLAYDVNSHVVYHFASDEAVHAEPAAVLPVAVQVQTKLGGLGIPRFAIMELDPFPQLEAPAVGLYLLPALYRAQGNYLECGGVNSGEGVNG